MFVAFVGASTQKRPARMVLIRVPVVEVFDGTSAEREAAVLYRAAFEEAARLGLELSRPLRITRLDALVGHDRALAALAHGV